MLTLTLTLVHHFWTNLIDYNYPVPFLLLLTAPVTMVAQFGTLHFLVSRNEQASAAGKKRLKQFLISRVWSNIAALLYEGMGIMFVVLPPQYQWVLAFLFPILREFTYKICYWIMIDHLQLKNGKLGVIIGVNAYHALFVAVKIGHISTFTTSVNILIVDFLINLLSCYNIVKLDKSITPDVLVNHRQIKKIRDREYQISKLILTEMMEIVLPLAYIISIVLAYYGPNAKILGNIGNDDWQYEIINDLGDLILSVSVMAIVDSFSAIIVGYWLWQACSINFLRESCCLIGDIWEVPTILIATMLNYVSPN